MASYKHLTAHHQAWHPGNLLAFAPAIFEDVIQHDEADLGRLIELLLNKCTWTEFHRACKGGTLEQLARRKGFTEQVAKISRTRWREYIVRDDTGVDPILPVIWDYGYLRCRDAREKMQWRNMYKKLFESKEHMDGQLHETCIKSKISGFVKRILPKTTTSFRVYDWINMNRRGRKGSVAWQAVRGNYFRCYVEGFYFY